MSLSNEDKLHVPVVSSFQRTRSSTSTESTCSSSSKIPGFYYDADKKRYFRLLPGNNNSNPLTVERVKAFEIERQRKLNSRKKIARAFPNYSSGRRTLSTALASSQQGLTSASSFCAFIQENRMSSLKCVSRVTAESILEIPAEKCKFLYGRPETGVLLGAWSSEAEGLVLHTFGLEAVGGEEPTVRAVRGRVVNIHPNKFQVVDVSIAEVAPKLHFALYAGNYYNSEREPVNSIHLLPLREHCDSSTPLNRERTDSMSQTYELSQKPLWSCAFNGATKSIVAGGENSIYEFSVEDGSHSVYKVPNEKVFSLTNDSNRLLYAGTNSGFLRWYDTRAKSESGSLKIGRGVSYVKVLEDESKLVVSSYDDSLVQVDVREQKIIFNYPQHDNKHRKLPFSVDESSNVLCSVGQDRMTRIWTLSNGKFLTSVLPPEMPSGTEVIPEPWVWHSDHWNIGGERKHEKSSLIVAAENELLAYCPH